MWFTPGPLSDEWKIPEGTGHKFLVKYLLAQQQSAYGKTILDQFTYKIMIRNMKLLCQHYSETEIKRAIALGCLTSEFPFSTKYIEEQIQWLRASRDCPIQQFYRNKS
jgi:hypothetical protein